jgi:mannosyltransferase OCH1-like enzyme
MIPKIIHYCWFGGKPLPKSAEKCIASWRKFLPDYEIKEWNESNFDVNCMRYTAEAYAARKYAYVSDYARFWVLYRYGGLYFDVDVEIIKPLDDIIARGPFMGCEEAYTEGATPSALGVAPGLGLGVNPGLGLVKELLDNYEATSFEAENQDRNAGIYKTVVQYTTELLVERGLKNTDEIQCVDGIYIYPKEYFNPLEHINQMHITENTRSIHWYDGTWQPKSVKWRRRFVRLLGQRVYGWILRLTHKVD